MSSITTCAAGSVVTRQDAGLDVATVGGLVHIRELGPGDGEVVDVVFAGLSPRSRYLRFQYPIGELSAAASEGSLGCQACKASRRTLRASCCIKTARIR